MTADGVTEVDLTRERGLWVCFSSSSSTYYFDTRRGALGEGASGARMLRARGGGPTAHGSADDIWKPLLSVRSIPVRDNSDGGQEIDPDREEMESVLRLGCRHFVYYDLSRLYGGWWMGREVERIVRLTRMPPVGKRTKAETGGRES